VINIVKIIIIICGAMRARTVPEALDFIVIIVRSTNPSDRLAAISVCYLLMVEMLVGLGVATWTNLRGKAKTKVLPGDYLSATSLWDLIEYSAMNNSLSFTGEIQKNIGEFVTIEPVDNELHIWVLVWPPDEHKVFFEETKTLAGNNCQWPRLKFCSETNNR
jgi:hypothetical protein